MVNTTKMKLPVVGSKILFRPGIGVSLRIPLKGFTDKSPLEKSAIITNDGYLLYLNGLYPIECVDQIEFLSEDSFCGEWQLFDQNLGISKIFSGNVIGFSHLPRYTIMSKVPKINRYNIQSLEEDYIASQINKFLN